jgi:hypothetical protein
LVVLTNDGSKCDVRHNTQQVRFSSLPMVEGGGVQGFFTVRSKMVERFSNDPYVDAIIPDDLIHIDMEHLTHFFLLQCLVTRCSVILTRVRAFQQLVDIGTFIFFDMFRSNIIPKPLSPSIRFISSCIDTSFLPKITLASSV